MILRECRNNERVMDGVGLNKRQDRWWWLVWTITPPPCLVTLNRPSLAVSRTPSVTLPVPPSSVPGPSQSIILSTASSSWHPLNPHQVRKAVDFSCAIHSTQSASIPPFPPFCRCPLMHHGKGVNQVCLVFLFCLHSIWCSPSSFLSFNQSGWPENDDFLKMLS